MAKKIADTLTTLADASRYLGVPVSTLNYRILTGDIKKHEYGPVYLIDTEQAREALEAVGYRPRAKPKGERTAA